MDSTSDVMRVRNRIDFMLRRRARFSSIEELIEDTAFSDEQKSALWLYAWAHQPRRVIRQETTLNLALLGSD